MTYLRPLKSTHRRGSAPLCAAIVLATGVAASTASAATVFPSALSGNTTGTADAAFLGAPDGNSGNVGTNWVGIGGQTVTYDFGPTGFGNGAGGDVNVYEVNYGSIEFTLMTVAVSLDGLTFTDITASRAAAVDIVGDEAHGAPSFAASYDLGALTMARYLRIDGNGNGAAGGTNAFDLDAVAALHVAPVPLPAGLPLLAGGFALLAGLKRRKRG